MVITSASGIRGKAPTDLTPLLALRASIAFIRVLNPAVVVIGSDSRPTSELLKRAIIAGLLNEGVKILDVGVQPTPVVFFAVRELGADGAIVITGSHNPAEWNAIKFADERGTFIREYVMNEIIKVMNELNSPLQRNLKVGILRKVEISESYLKHITRFIDTKLISKLRPRVIVDPGSGAASHIAPKLLRLLGCRVVSINANPLVTFRNYEPTATSLAISAALTKGSFEIGFGFDSDADRVVMINSKGTVLAPDYTLAMALEGYHLKTGYRGVVVVNCATSNLVSDVASRIGCKINFSKVGEVHVLEAMEELKARIGGEGSSAGVIIMDVNPTRDGLLASALILEFITRTRMSLEEYINRYPRYFNFHHKVPVDPSLLPKIITLLEETLIGKFTIESFDGIKVWLKDKAWVLFRPSKTEPYLRIIGEATTASEANRLEKWAFTLINNILKVAY